MCYISGMLTFKKKNIPIYLPFAAIILSLIALALYEAGIISIPSHRAQPLNKVSFGNYIYPEEYNYAPNLLLVNKDYHISEDYPLDIVFYRETDVPMNAVITEDYGRMSDYIRNELGERLYVSSSYRSQEDQERIYNEEGPDIAAVPGESEHQTGLALDVYAMYFAGAAFPDCGVGQFVLNNCSQFGFIIRYPYGAEDITGFSYEPWHIRYVGYPHAQIISDSHLTLEEYLDSFEVGSWYSYDSYYIARLPEDELQIPQELSGYDITVSPDNTGFIVVTINTAA